GSLECLKYAHENGCPWDSHTCSFAAETGQLECLKYARGRGCPWDAWTCFYAAEGGHLDVLKWAVENGCPLEGEFVLSSKVAASKKGHLDCLKFFQEQEGDTFLHEDLFDTSARGVLEWLCFEATARGTLEELILSGKVAAAKRGDLDTLKFFQAQEGDTFLLEDLFDNAAKYIRWGVLEWLCLEAAACDNLELLEKGLQQCPSHLLARLAGSGP
ncbi:ankyrin repeat protein (Partial), partial [Seminavis robusta]